jgi:uncharacterized protein (TIGR00251 family)
MRLTVRVTPRSSTNAISSPDDSGVVHARVTAAPTDGAANEAVTKLLAKSLGLPPRDVVLVSGAASRTKVFDVSLSEAELRLRLGASH